MASGRPEIVIQCDHAGSGEKAFIRRYRWSVGRQSWIGYGPVGGTEALTPDGRTTLKCPTCRETVPARHENLIPALDRMADAGASSLPFGSLGRLLLRVK